MLQPAAIRIPGPWALASVPVSFKLVQATREGQLSVRGGLGALGKPQAQTFFHLWGPRPSTHILVYSSEGQGHVPGERSICIRGGGWLPIAKTFLKSGPQAAGAHQWGANLPPTWGEPPHHPSRRDSHPIWAKYRASLSRGCASKSTYAQLHRFSPSAQATKFVFSLPSTQPCQQNMCCQLLQRRCRQKSARS